MEKPQRDELTAELLEMARVDQAMRTAESWDASVDTSNTARLRQLVKEFGWPTITSVGREAAQAAWLLAQHADADVDFQQACLIHMQSLPSDEVDAKLIAYLEDRVRVNTGRPQVYGTQFFMKAGQFGPQPIEQDAELDVRRAAVGMEPFAVYTQTMLRMYQERQK